MANPNSRPGNIGRNRTTRLWLVILIWIFFAEIVAGVSGLIPGDESAATVLTIVVTAFLAAALLLHVLFGSYAPTRLPRTRSANGGAVDLR
jgi:hypothetical protein